MADKGENIKHVKIDFTREDLVKGLSPLSDTFVQESSNFLLNRTSYRPKIGIICGSGLAGLGEAVEDPNIFDYDSVPHFPFSTAPGHKSSLIFGKLNGVEVFMMQGRFHLYEGYSIQTCSMPVRVMKAIGVETMVVTNAAGGLTSSLEVGDIMLIKDHINFQGCSGINPLLGKNDDRLGPRFFSTKHAYDPKLRSAALEVGEALGLNLKVGVYTMMGGPNFETPAELRFMKMIGVDAVGMSTVHEVIVARHCGMKVLGFSLITNICDTEYEDEGNEMDDLYEEVKSVADQRSEALKHFVTELVKKL